jgi:hypothetical protein
MTQKRDAIPRDYYERKTGKHGTMTNEGYIAHRKYMGIELPVKIRVSGMTARDLWEYPTPVRDALGRLQYALPGGHTFVDNATPAKAA